MSVSPYPNLAGTDKHIIISAGDTTIQTDEWLECLTAKAPVATVLGLIPASVDAVESEGRQKKQCWIYYIKIKNPPKNPPKNIPYLKGQCHKILQLLVFFMNKFPQAPEYAIRAVSNFFKNTRRFSQLKVHHWCHWHRWQKEIIFNHKSFNYFVWTPLGSRVNL